MVASVLLLLRNKYALGSQSNRILIERILNLAVGVLILGLFHFRIVGVEGGLLVGTILTLPLCILYIVRTCRREGFRSPKGTKKIAQGKAKGRNPGLGRKTKILLLEREQELKATTDAFALL